MSLQGKTEDEIRALEQALVALLTELGGSAGNIRLMRRLQWPEDDYWPVRNRLVDAGVVRLYRARGGAVELLPPEGVQPDPQQEQLATFPGPNLPEPQAEAERDLYEPVATVLREQWSRDLRFRHQIVETTASQGRRNTGGAWTRPDIVVAALRVFPFLPGKYFDLITFEIKPRWALSVTAVYEALAHRRSATQSYVWLHCPDPDGNVEALARLKEEADRHGIGLIVATEPGNYETWLTKCDPIRVEPDPELLNDFIAIQMSGGAKDELAAWVR